jgi:HD-GYP domain-containing protein (c-di-GMP phosphodiesterase class II)
VYPKGRIDNTAPRQQRGVVTEGHMETWFSRVEPVLGAALELRDLHTSVHCGRVSQMALMFAEDLGLRGDALLALDVAARFHDVGKIGIPDTVLYKHGSLDDAEWEIMKGHSARGEYIIRMDAGLVLGDEIARTVRHHHEHYDGNGYPDGLREQAIPLPARVLSVIDSYDAIRNRRAYHAAQSHEDALFILASERGTKHDPQILDAFLSYERSWFDRLS